MLRISGKRIEIQSISTPAEEEQVCGDQEIENILSCDRSQKKTPQKKARKGCKEETQNKILELNPHIDNHEKYVLILISY